MINNSKDLIEYICSNSNKNLFQLSPNSHKVLGISQDELELYIQQLVDAGYANRYIRNIVITEDGIKSIQ